MENLKEDESVFVDLFNFIKSYFFVILSPSYWLMNDKYDKEWDRELNRLMDSNKFIEIDTYTAEIGGVVVWIVNQPYGTMCRYEDRVGPLKHRPSRWTIRRAIKKLENDI